MQPNILDAQYSDFESSMTVVERPNFEGKINPAFKYAVEDGTYYFRHISLPATMGSGTPTIRLDNSEGCISVERDDELLWKSGHILNRGGGMGNEEKLYLSNVPTEYIAIYSGERERDDGYTDALSAKDFQIGDIITLRAPKNSLYYKDSDDLYTISNQLKQQWEDGEDVKEGLRGWIENPEAKHEREVKIHGDDAGTIDETKSHAQDQLEEILDNFCFEPNGAA